MFKEIANAPCADTEQFMLHEELADIASKLENHIASKSRHGTTLSKIVLTEEYRDLLWNNPREFHKQVSRIVAAQEGIAEKDASKIVWHQVDGDVFYFSKFKRPVPASYDSRWSQRRVTLLLDLLFKQHFLNRSALFDEMSATSPYRLAAPLLMPRLTLFPNKQDKKDSEPETRGIIRGSECSFYLTPYKTLSVLLNGRAYKVSSHRETGLTIEDSLEDISSLFSTSDRTTNLYTQDRYPAQEDRIPYFEFPKNDDPDNSKSVRTRVYMLNRIVQWLLAELDAADIKYSRLHFQATHRCSDVFIPGEKLANSNRNVIVNITGYKDPLVFGPIIDELRNAGLDDVILYDDGKDQTHTDPAAFPIGPEQNYIFIQAYRNNMWFKKTGGQFNHDPPPHEIEQSLSEGNLQDADWYSLFKIHRLPTYNRGKPIVSQAMAYYYQKMASISKKSDSVQLFWHYREIVPAKKNKKNGSVLPGQQPALFSNDLIENTIKIRQYKEVRATFENVVSQLKLKRAMYFNKPIPLHDAANISFTLIGTRAPRKGQEIYVEIDGDVSEGKLVMGNYRFGSLGEHRHLPVIKSRKVRKNTSDERLYDNQFFIVDHDNKNILRIFASPGWTPTIIGDSTRPFLDWFNREKFKRGAETCPIPYVVGSNKRKGSFRHKTTIYIEHPTEKPYLAFLIPDAKAPNQSLPNQNRVYHVVAYNIDGKPIEDCANILNLPIVKLFFQTMTFDLVRVNENSKSSILQKFVSILIRN